MRATGGDPDSVTNTTLQLRSEYGDLWERIRRGFTLTDLDTPQVKQAEDWYASRPDYMARMVERSRRYLYYIVIEVEKRGMPLEAALLPMIESAYNPMAYSTSRASGIWQFMPSTGKSYGMKQTWWLDERRDVVAATDGALDYLQKLYAEFGDWYLALAAYNWGEGSVRRAIAANQKRGLPTDYLSLPMPAETRNYVPKLQAVKNIVRDPEAYELELAPIPDAPYFTVVRTTRKMDVKIAAELAEMPLEQFLSQAGVVPSTDGHMAGIQDQGQRNLAPGGRALRSFAGNLAHRQWHRRAGDRSRRSCAVGTHAGAQRRFAGKPAKRGLHDRAERTNALPPSSQRRNTVVDRGALCGNGTGLESVELRDKPKNHRRPAPAGHQRRHVGGNEVEAKKDQGGSARACDKREDRIGETGRGQGTTTASQAPLTRPAFQAPKTKQATLAHRLF